MKEHFFFKITSGGAYLGIIIGSITQETTLKLSAISYLIGIILGLITICFKIYEFNKSIKNDKKNNNTNQSNSDN